MDETVDVDETVDEMDSFQKSLVGSGMQHYGGFSERGYRVDAFIRPTPLEWYVTFRSGDEVVRDAHEPMMYAPIFGVDVGDTAALEDLVGRTLAELPNREMMP